jgi:flagellar L-ring protein precursor FlgH
MIAFLVTRARSTCFLQRALLLAAFSAGTVWPQSSVTVTAPSGAPPQAAPVPQNKIQKAYHAIVPPSSNLAQSTMSAYLQRVRAESIAAQPTEGSIWTDSGRFARMGTDVRAMRAHDLIQVVVDESLASSTDGAVAGSRASSANSQLTSLFGTLHAANALQNLVNQNSSSALTAKGASANNSSLSTVFGGEVVEVLPNGALVIEAARQVEFSQQTQTILLRGIVRPEDISQQNQVLSTAIASMELEVKGKGIINDYTHRQNALVRLLQKILIF